MAPCATPLKDAARRLRRWPAAILDRRCARRPGVVQAGAEKRPQPNRETGLRRAVINGVVLLPRGTQI